MLLYVVAIIKISDMGGFAFGVAFGKHKMCPRISPGKSWEGMAGSIFASIVISCAFMPITRFGVWKAIAFGVVAAVVGTLGDLIESRFKRECGVKDSATFMPAGMGGFLDMFDSLVFAPAVLYPFI
jgi:phosphatidate cytidylyltransferase